MKNNKLTFKKKIKGVSLFANVGLAETYFKELGIEIVVANEIIEERAKFYSHLFPDTNMIVGDITEKSIFDKVIYESKINKIDFLIATPPCQGMSTAGKKDSNDTRNFLIYYAVEAIKSIMPKFVILENVTMQQHTKILYKGKPTLIPEYLFSELREFYNFNKDRIINSMDYGIPQSRSRYILLLTRKDEKITWNFPEKEQKIVTLKEAIADLPSLDPQIREVDRRNFFPLFEEKRQEGLKVSKWHYPPTHAWRHIEWMMHTPSGKSAFENKHHFPKKDGRRIKGAPRTYMRMSWDKPATTILQNSGSISTFSTVHPGREIVSNSDDRLRLYSDARALSIYELMILSSLPFDWNIPEWASETLIRKVIGEGIPPLLIKKIIINLIKEGNYDR